MTADVWLPSPEGEDFLGRMDRQLAGWSDPVAQLQSVLDNDGLSLFCQPVRSLLGTQDYPMAEVLVRMRSEEQSLLPPGDFLPVFEHYKMMAQLDRWVVRNVARFLRRGSKIPCFTVNLSSEAIEDPEFPDYVAEQLRLGVTPGAILFEIDEPDLLAHPWAAEVAGAALKKLGSGTLIDGFGRRAVSFSPLKTLRADFIKVDGCITRKVLDSSPAALKFSAVVRVGETLGIGVIAECVESQDILTRLKALGAGYAQGFGIAHPVPIDSLASG